LDGCRKESTGRKNEGTLGKAKEANGEIRLILFLRPNLLFFRNQIRIHGLALIGVVKWYEISAPSAVVTVTVVSSLFSDSAIVTVIDFGAVPVL
jgi:hypothetical protein